jgi:hypothetical protein
MLMAKPRLAWRRGKLWALWATQTSTSGGVRETDVKALAVSPTGRPAASQVVTTVTPLAK